RRVLEFGEILKSGDASVIYRWNLRSDTFVQIADLSRLAELMMLYGGYTKAEINQDIKEKSSVLEWMIANSLFDVDNVGWVVANYYKDKESVMQIVRSNTPF